MQMNKERNNEPITLNLSARTRMKNSTKKKRWSKKEKKNSYFFKIPTSAEFKG